MADWVMWSPYFGEGLTTWTFGLDTARMHTVSFPVIWGHLVLCVSQSLSPYIFPNFIHLRHPLHSTSFSFTGARDHSSSSSSFFLSCLDFFWLLVDDAAMERFADALSSSVSSPYVPSSSWLDIFRFALADMSEIKLRCVDSVSLHLGDYYWGWFCLHNLGVIEHHWLWVNYSYRGRGWRLSHTRILSGFCCGFYPVHRYSVVCNNYLTIVNVLHSSTCLHNSVFITSVSYESNIEILTVSLSMLPMLLIASHPLHLPLHHQVWSFSWALSSPSLKIIHMPNRQFAVAILVVSISCASSACPANLFYPVSRTCEHSQQHQGATR